MLSSTRQRTAPTTIDAPSCIPAIVMTYPTGDSDIEEESVVLLSPSVSKSPTKLRRTTVSNHTLSSYPSFGSGIEKGSGIGLGITYAQQQQQQQRPRGFMGMRGGVVVTILIAVLIVLSLGMKEGKEGAVDEWAAVKDILKYGVKVETQWSDFPPIKLKPGSNTSAFVDVYVEAEVRNGAAPTAEVAVKEEAAEARVASSNQRRASKNIRRRGPARIEKSS